MSDNPILFQANGQGVHYQDLIGSLREMGIVPGDSVLVHSDVGRFGTLAEVRDRGKYLDYFVRALQEVVGAKGSIIMPTFTYSFCNKEVFDPVLTPSTVGILGEHFRRVSGVQRSLEGIFSVAAMGPQQGYFIDVGQDCFGDLSIFEKLFQQNSHLVFLGETFDITYMHHVEQTVGVPYRYFKDFPGEIRIAGELIPYQFRYFVRDLSLNVAYDLENIASYFMHEGCLRMTKLGASKIRSVRAQDAFVAIAEGLKRDQRLLLKK